LRSAAALEEHRKEPGEIEAAQRDGVVVLVSAWNQSAQSKSDVSLFEMRGRREGRAFRVFPVSILILSAYLVPSLRASAGV